MEYTHVTLNDILPQQRKNRGGGGCRKRRRALKKSPRALKSNTAGFEKKAAGFGSRHGGLCDETPQASETGARPIITESLPITRCACVVSPEAYPATWRCVCGFTESLLATRRCVCVVSPEAYPSPGAVSCTASTLHPFFATAACHHLHFAPKHLKHFGGRFTESVPVTRCACVVSPKACSLPGAVSCTASMFCSISATELVATPHLLPSSFDVPERSANGASPNPGEPRRSFL